MRRSIAPRRTGEIASNRPTLSRPWLGGSTLAELEIATSTQKGQPTRLALEQNEPGIERYLIGATCGSSRLNL